MEEHSVALDPLKTQKVAFNVWESVAVDLFECHVDTHSVLPTVKTGQRAVNLLKLRMQGKGRELPQGYTFENNIQIFTCGQAVKT